jgi:hypothetical protein
MMPPDNNNSPCDNPNPPSWCTDASVPLEFFEIFMWASLLFGLLMILKFYYDGNKIVKEIKFKK